MNMKEQLINFKTAKLAKEKGFNEGSYSLYTYPDSELKTFHAENYNSEQDNLQFEAPTQSLLQKWLRDEHNICVSIMPFQNIFTIYIYYLTDGIEIDGFENYTKDCNTYEEALEYGLQDALKLINE